MHSVRIGSTRMRGSLSGPLPDGMIEVGGRIASEMPSTSARIVPVTNSGSAISASETPEMAWSAARPRRTPASVPSTTDTGMSTASVPSASTRLFPRRAPMNALTDSLEPKE